MFLHTFVKEYCVSLNTFSGYRLKEERQRLGLKQEELAEIMGIRREMLSNYENGKTTPSGETLAGFAHAGLNVNYLLTGERNPVFQKVLTAREETLIDNYRNADEEGKKAAYKILDALSKQNADSKKSA